MPNCSSRKPIDAEESKKTSSPIYWPPTSCRKLRRCSVDKRWHTWTWKHSSGRGDPLNILNIQQLHGASSLGMTAYAIGIEKMALRRISDHSENFLCFVRRGRRSNENISCRNADALGDGQAGGRYRGVLAGNRIAIVCVRLRNNPWDLPGWLQQLRELLAVERWPVYRNESTVRQGRYDTGRHLDDRQEYPRRR